jgi:hypothetical protein
MKYNVAFLESDIRDELENLKQLSLEYSSIEKLLKFTDEEVSFFDKAATGYFLHSFYNGYENIFGMIARFFENDLGPQSWHRDLLKRMKLQIPGYRPRLIDNETYIILNEFWAFRHVFRHCYSFQLDWEREKIVAANYPAAWKLFKRQVEDFLETLQTIALESTT